MKPLVRLALMLTPLMRAYTKKAEHAMCASDEPHRSYCEDVCGGLGPMEHNRAVAEHCGKGARTMHCDVLWWLHCTARHRSTAGCGAALHNRTGARCCQQAAQLGRAPRPNRARRIDSE
ncbi:hypothetical protein B0H14DRAFT_3010803 [Mycena olivaceomarginata]|nr:hypothetical protein B0H14DRAFT_3010803 [Mycena olivaceomarginata]